MKLIIYEDDSYRVESSLIDASRPTVVSFSSYNRKSDPSERRAFTPAFGESAIRSLGLNSLGVQTNRNDWYQDTCVMKSLDVVRSTAPASQPLVTYGSSMGAFAAINFSEHLKADFFISISPQVTIADSFFRKNADRRWPRERSSIKVNNDFILTGVCKKRTGLILYDSKHRVDTLHAEQCALLTAGKLLELPFSGHPSGRFFNKIYGLKRLILELIEGSLDLEIVRAIADKESLETLEFLSTRPELRDRFVVKYLSDPTQISYETIINLIRGFRSPGHVVDPTSFAFLISLIVGNRHLFLGKRARVLRVGEGIDSILQCSEMEHLSVSVKGVLKRLVD